MFEYFFLIKPTYKPLLTAVVVLSVHLKLWLRMPSCVVKTQTSAGEKYPGQHMPLSRSVVIRQKNIFVIVYVIK